MSENKTEIEGNAEFNELEKIKKEVKENKDDEIILEQNSGSLKIIKNLTGFVIGTTEYIALLVIDSFAKTFGLDTEGKSLNDILNMLYIAIEDPDVRDVLIKIMESLSDLLVIFIDELKEPMREVIDEMIDLGGESIEKLAKTLVTASIDALGIIPVGGEVLEAVMLFSTIVKQIQASVGVFLKTSVLLTSFIETGLGRVLPIKKGVDDVIAVINSIKERIPTMENMKNKAKERAGRMVHDTQDKSFEKTKRLLGEKRKKDTAAAVAESIRSLEKSEQQRSAAPAPAPAQETAPTVSEPTVSEPTVSAPPVSEPTVSEPTVSAPATTIQQGGSMKKIKKDIRNKSNHIKKTIKRFLNRNSNIRKVTRRVTHRN
jgi:hypothetical protein